MNARSALIVVVLLVSIATGIIAQWRIHARLVYEMDAMRRMVQTNASPRRDASRTSIPKDMGERPPALISSPTFRSTERIAGPPEASSTSVKANLSAAGLVRPESWRNVGRETPSSAFETLQWALDRGETDTLAASLAFEPEVRRKLDELYAHLSEDVRSKYRTPESIIALLVAGTSKGPQAFLVLDETFQGPDTATVRVRMQEADGLLKESDMALRREADGWKAVIPEQKALEKMHEFFPEATWKSLEGPARDWSK